MSSDQPNERLSDEDAKLLMKTIADVERQEAGTPKSAAESTDASRNDEEASE